MHVLKKSTAWAALLVGIACLVVLACAPRTAFAAAYQSYDNKIISAVEMGGDEDNIRLAHAACVVSYSKRVWHGGGYDGTKLWMKVYKEIFPGNKWVRCCDSNLSAMIRWTGVDTTFPCHADNLLKYVKKSDKWENLGYWHEDESKLLPGDLLVYYGGTVNGKQLKGLHIAMYVGGDIVQDVYKAYVKGTDGDVGKPSNDAAYVAAHSGNANLNNKRNGIGGSGAPCMDTARTAYTKGIYSPGLYQIIRLKGAISSEQSKKAIAERKTIGEGGVYRLTLKGKKSLKFSVSGASRKSGAAAQLSKRDQWASQRWRFEFTPDGYYRIVNIASGKSLSLVGNKAKNKVKVVQSKWKYGKNQKWRVDKTAKGYQISSAINKKFSLGTASGKKRSGKAIRLYKSSKKWALEWKLRMVKPSVADGVYVLSNGHSGRTLYAAANGGKTVKQVKPNGLDGCQQWRVTYDASRGYYTIQNVASGKYLAASGWGVKQVAYKASKISQKWEIKRKGSTWVIRNAGSGKVLSIANGSKKKNAKASLALNASSSVQRWSPRVVADADVAQPAAASGQLTSAR